MQVNFTKDEKQVIYELYTNIAENPDALMTESEARVVSHVLKRSGGSQSESNEFKPEALESIRYIIKQVKATSTPSEFDKTFDSIINKVFKALKY